MPHSGDGCRASPGRSGQIQPCDRAQKGGLARTVGGSGRSLRAIQAIPRSVRAGDLLDGARRGGGRDRGRLSAAAVGAQLGAHRDPGQRGSVGKPRHRRCEWRRHRQVFTRTYKRLTPLYALRPDNARRLVTSRARATFENGRTASMSVAPTNEQSRYRSRRPPNANRPLVGRARPSARLPGHVVYGAHDHAEIRRNDRRPGRPSRGRHGCRPIRVPRLVMGRCAQVGANCVAVCRH